MSNPNRFFHCYRFHIDAAAAPAMTFADAEASLQLAMVALEGLYGEARVRLEARYIADEEDRTLTLDVRTPVGLALAQVFANLLIKEFGPDSFAVTRLTGAQAGITPTPIPPAAAAPVAQLDPG